MLALLLITALLGGASRLHEGRLAIVQMAALPAAVLAISALLKGPSAISRLALGILLGLIAIPLLQLVPLPPSIWKSLPGREEAALALGLIDSPSNWLPMTLSPDRTWRSFLSLVPPVAAFLAVPFCAPDFRLRLFFGVLAFTATSVVLGAAQLASGSLYLWPTTDAGAVVGFFANRNHLATLCLISLPFASVLGARVLRRGRDHSRLALWLAALFIGAIIVALAVIRSRMGVLLLGPVLAASLLAAWFASGGGRPKPLFLAMVGASGLALAAVAFFALAPVLERFDAAGAREGRFENWPIVAQAAGGFQPVGSGIGSFDRVYRSVEPLERLDPTFFNQAHNDYLETWLEAGWLGLGLVAAFLVWFSRRTWIAWRSRVSTDNDLRRASTIAIGVVLLHSAVDYPLRTELVAVLFALCCGFLDLAASKEAEPEPSSRARSRRSRRS